MVRKLACWVVPLSLVVLVYAAQGQSDDGKDKVAAARKESVASLLTVTIDMKDFQNPMTLKEALGLLYEKVAALGKECPILVSTGPFKQEYPDAPDLYDTPIKFPAYPKRLSLGTALQVALDQLPMEATFLIRGNYVEIVPTVRAKKEFVLNQTFIAEFKNRPFAEVLEDLEDLGGTTIALDPRAKEKARSPVTARFFNDVCLQDAVRMLAEMADLKLVHLPTGLFVTTPQHAEVMRKELKKIYEPEAPANMQGIPGGYPAGPSPLMLPSPLTPPAAPERSANRQAAAAV